MRSVTTPKGTELPLLNLKGKDYLMVAHRLVWFNETSERFTIDTDFLVLTDEQTVARAKVLVYNKEGVLVKSATATKRETKKDFSDHTEKAETAAIGRCLALMGFGTQFAVADLDEGSRLADSPLSTVKSEVKATPQDQPEKSPSEKIMSELVTNNTFPSSAKISTFRKNKPAVVETPKAEASNGWGE